jgi:cytochrome c peroxidase
MAHADHEEAVFIPSEVRRVAFEAGLDSLRRVKPPKPEDLDDFLRSGSSAKKAAIQLGKALYWDMQVGSDGQACASCHFHAGADNRAKNQLSPSLRNEDPGLRHTFDPTATGGGGPNYELTAADFPFHRLEDSLDRTSPVLHDSDDVCSSQGVFRADFLQVVRGQSAEVGRPSADPAFNVDGVNVRRVEPRNTPSVINAVYNFANFWDGSAHNIFNGVSSGGPADGGATILVEEDGELVPTAIRIDNSSLASQAVAPPRSDLEMAFFDRPFRDLGRKLLSLRPLGRQLVHPKDSVLGELSRAKFDDGRVSGKRGLKSSYSDLIKKAFEKRFWDSDEKVDGYSQMENNFSLFFGLAIQMYETTLVSDRTPFDRFMEGGDDDLTPEQLEGLLIFINRGPGLSDDPIFDGSAQGNCVSCHRGAEFTAATYSSLGGAEDGARALIGVQETSKLAGDLIVSDKTAFFDIGFSNIGVRPTAEDLGRGGVAFGLPLSFVRQRLLGLPFAPELPACGGAGQPACPEGNRVTVDGAFKVPGLRNVELTAPYFHNGGQATLRQVVVFYERLGDFSNENLRDVDPNLARVFFTEPEEEPLVEFMLSLTDKRVREERKPFDHPQLFVPNGHLGNHAVLDCVSGLQACDDLLEIAPVGEKGRREAGLSPLGTFLELDPLHQ